MFIQQSAQPIVGLIQDIPKQLLAKLMVGQKLEAMILKPALAAELVQIRLADTILNIRTPQPLASGQTIKLEVVYENGKPALKFVSADHIVKAADVARDTLIANLKIGQQLPAEVIKVLAQNKLLVNTELNNHKLPIEVDVSRLNKTYKQGDRAVIEVANLKPLQVFIQSDKTTVKQQLIADKIQELMRTQDTSSPKLRQLETILQKQAIPEEVKTAVQSLLNQSIDKTNLTEGHSFKQALINSGVFTEKQLVSDPVVIKQDFKANIIKLIETLRMVIERGGSATDGELRSLINQLPAQVQSALAASGRTPQQLLNILLSSATTQPTETPQATLNASLISEPKQAALLAQLMSKNVNKQLEATMSQLQMIMKEAIGVHNKIQLNQLTMLREADTTATTTQASWLFDVPIKDKQQLDLVQLRIDQEKHKSKSDAQDDIWNVQLRLDTQNLGPVEAKLTLDKQAVTIVIQAERADSAALLAAHLEQLQQALEKIDVDVSHMSCHCGPVSQRSLTESLIETSSLLDVSV